MTDVFPNYIGGSWRTGAATIEDINPSDLSDVVGHYAQASGSDVADAVAAAEAGAEVWGRTGLEQRATALDAIGRELMGRSAELGELLSREEGKPRAEGVGEVYRAGQFFTYYAAEVIRLQGDKAESVRPEIEVDVSREPIGVVAVISPWNFPTATAAWKIAPALAFGNAVIWKPANLTPASAWALTEIISRQNLPAGAFNLLMGSGSAVGQPLIEARSVNAVSFTGSLDVGRGVAAAAASNLTKVQLEMGSKNALVVMEDADLDVAVTCAVAGGYSGTGQKCTASSRLVVHRTVHDAFVEKLVAALGAMKVGHALEDGVTMGPVASEAQLASNMRYLDLAKQEGCEIACGGERLERVTEGYFMSPALLTGSSNTMRVNREEVFGPIAAVIEVGDYEEALSVTNDTEFGLTAGIITSSLARATHFRRNARTGCVMVNLPTAGTDYHVPFGGRKNSSYGPREQGRYAAEFYTQVKTAYIRAGNPEI
ncbi:aldehyde dehydrogenase family protein [Amorphus coralli]|uniref:aldehyde dehydrogenase family protein n=1 Tax=Amorphus coralli TaxID=340680 RepID=UPI0003664D8F|nr:aldehyde dehydrogenase family protein [Amorphus coralli]